MTIKKTKDGAKLTIALEGKLDTKSAPQLEEIIREETDDITDLRLEMDGVQYISSAGLRVLLSVKKRKRHSPRGTVSFCWSE